MQSDALELLRCPRSDRRLELQTIGRASDGSIEFGTLTAAGFTYPIVGGIAMLSPGVDEVTELVQRQRLREAVALAALGDVGRSRTLPLLDAVTGLRGVGRLAGPLARTLRGRERARDVEELYGSPPGPDVVADPVELLFLGRRHPIPEGFNYFRYRFGTPRYLVGLALIDALPVPAGAVLDAGCGAGHLLWAIGQRRLNGPLIGIDPSFAQLLSATRLMPGATFVCGDGTSLPFPDGAFERVISSDVLPYVAAKPLAVRELIRVLGGDGHLVLTALRNAHQEHVHGGEPLSPSDWAGLVSGLSHVRLMGDDAILDNYLERRGPGDLTGKDASVSQTLSIVAGHTDPPLYERTWETWPHAFGTLAPHPLLRPVRQTPGGTLYQRTFPSATYASDNRRIVEYLPEECVIPELSGAGEGDSEETASIEALISSVALLGLPAKTVPLPEQ